MKCVESTGLLLDKVRGTNIASGLTHKRHIVNSLFYFGFSDDGGYQDKVGLQDLDDNDTIAVQRKAGRDPESSTYVMRRHSEGPR